MASGNLLIDIVDYTISNSEATTDGVDIFRDAMPDAPDDVIVFVEYAGDPLPGNQAARRSVQCFVRNTDYATARAKIHKLYKLFCTPESPFRTFNGRWALVEDRQTPYKVDVDAQNRTVFTFSMVMATTRDNY
jgi:hypothetical protein